VEIFFRPAIAIRFMALNTDELTSRDRDRTSRGYIIGSENTAVKGFISCEALPSYIERVNSALYCKISFHLIHVKNIVILLK